MVFCIDVPPGKINQIPDLNGIYVRIISNFNRNVKRKKSSPVFAAFLDRY